MKVFFDEDVPRKLARFLLQHEIQTVVSMEWGGLKNGALLRLIEREGFDVFLTGDKNMEKQQSLQGRPSPFLSCRRSWPVVRPHVQKIMAALDEAQAGTIKKIECAVFIPRARSNCD